MLISKCLVQQRHRGVIKAGTKCPFYSLSDAMWLCMVTLELIYTRGSKELTKALLFSMLCNMTVNIWHIQTALVQPFILVRSCYSARLCISTSLRDFLLNIIWYLQWSCVLHSNAFPLCPIFITFWMYPSRERQWHNTEANSQTYLSQVVDECKQISRWQLASVYSFIFKCWTIYLIYLLSVPVEAYNLLLVM